MKKVSMFFGKGLQAALSTSERFKELPLLDHALSVTNFFVVMAATGIVPQQHFPILSCDPDPPNRYNFGDQEVTLFKMAYGRASRIEVQIDTGTVDACLSVKIAFYKPGRNAKFLEIFISVDSQAVRRYDILPPENDEDISIQYGLVLRHKIRSRRSAVVR